MPLQKEITVDDLARGALSSQDPLKILVGWRSSDCYPDYVIGKIGEILINDPEVKPKLPCNDGLNGVTTELRIAGKNFFYRREDIDSRYIFLH